ncbi:EAL domain-containing protein [Bradyrhizobium sp. WYCCWR 13023]|uniref:EAL domain-containing protein n=1 Tax=Bradyrhizobium zhengyangense TaxID=2911009 RepID=A0A9X1UAD4_9BRAD|nr:MULTISPECIES: EAL domain-containing protein [Bradyrhizobium]MCG2628289.1 EAL domain-containing protein [Bradyrhizobium zhengyangense]MCG2643408.1 EAL domain-containing protein [Bradyrhizobium zhengyangense]MCG2670277.1 EAL domain-containing protein [Bradyrhizobium zhengyangense]MDN4985988.1 EAL domain-containing protein [Bradyrhizobium sp. WYCCWR 13022]MDN5002632.1 EAL domain-containing protein [Bradyrhizobium sp. WYCCWR 12677]
MKVDRPFVAELGTNQRSDAIMRAIVSRTRSLGIPLLAEGIETEQQWSWLPKLGCNAAQGYLIGRLKLPHAVLSHMMSGRSRRRKMGLGHSV